MSGSYNDMRKFFDPSWEVNSGSPGIMNQMGGMFGLNSNPSMGPNGRDDVGFMPIGSMSPTGGSSWFGPNSGLGMNLGTAQLGLSGLGALGSLWGGLQAQGLAKKQFDFTRNTTNTNLANQIKSYNTALTDRALARGKVAGSSDSEVQDYITRNSMSR